MTANQQYSREDLSKIVSANVCDYGWHCVNVIEDDGHPPWSYTIGLYETYGFPELIIGRSRATAHHILETIASRLEKGETPDLESPALNLIPGVYCLYREVLHRYYRLSPLVLQEAKRQPGSIRAYLELHIEQGALLEQQHIQIGIVEGIVGVLDCEVTVEGFANHAGTTPMDQRHDALLSAARFADKFNALITSIPGRQVGTIGWIKAEPGSTRQSHIRLRNTRFGRNQSQSDFCTSQRGRG
jgi:hypothetical protein